MRLEDEIQQKEFRNQYHKLAVNLIYTYNWLIPHLRAVLAPYNLTLQQYNILRILRGQYPQPASMVLLRERMLDKQSDVSRLIDRLVSKQLVVRKVCPNDRRRMDILIGDSGLTILAALDKKLLDFDGILDNLSLDEAATLNRLLDDLRG